jgi:hypothetical protein
VPEIRVIHEEGIDLRVGGIGSSVTGPDLGHPVDQLIDATQRRRDRLAQPAGIAGHRPQPRREGIDDLLDRLLERAGAGRGRPVGARQLIEAAGEAAKGRAKERGEHLLLPIDQGCLIKAV